MSDYFTYSNLTPNTVARAADVNARFQSVSAGFDLLPPPAYIKEDRLTYSVDTGAANAYVATPAIPITVYTSGLHIVLKAANANTGASTINVSGLGVKSIVRADGSALQLGDIVVGQILDLTYDGTNFRLSMAFAEMSPAGVMAKIAAGGNMTVNGSVTATSFVNNGQTIDGLTAFGVSLAEAANAAAGRSLLALGTMATETATNYLTTASAATTYAPLASPALTGTPTGPTATPGTNTTQLATTAFVAAAIGGGGAPLNSPAFTGNPTGPTPAVDDNDTSLATTAYVIGQLNSTAGTIAMNGTQAAGSSLKGARADHVHPSDTSRAPTASPSFTGNGSISGNFSVADDPYSASWNGSTNVPTKNAVYDQMELKAPLASPVFTGDPQAPTPLTADNDTSIATTAYVKANLTSYLTTASAASTYAPLASPALTGNPTATTQAAGNSTTRLATTAFVQGELEPDIQSAGADSITPTFADDLVQRGAVTAAVTFNNPTGTAIDGWGIVLRIKANGAYAISYGTQYRDVGVTRPTTTVNGKWLYLGMIFNSADTKWDIVSVNQEA